MIHGTLERIDGRPALRFVRTLHHSIERVWQAVSVPAELERWFPAAVAWTPAVGESIAAGGSTVEVTEVEPPHRLAWTFAGQQHRFELEELADGSCRLTFTHIIDDLTAAAQTATGWETYLSRLDPQLRDAPISEELAHRQWADLHEQYAELFGVDPAPGRRFAASLRGGS